jgi:hypothetical protein
MEKTCIIYLASPIEFKISEGDSRYIMLKSSIKNITKHLNLPMIIFNEDYEDVHKNELKNIYNNINFQKVDFSLNGLEFIKFGRPYGYMMMCRFFSGIMQNLDILQSYDSYIRFDDDSFLIEPFLNQDKFLNELINSDYSFRTLFIDGQPKYGVNNKPMQSLYDITKSFVFEEKLITIEQYNLFQKTLRKQCFLDNENLYTGLAPYNNFHYSKLSIWNDTIIKKYTNKLLELNGCLTKYWMDANIHAMIIFILMPLRNKQVNSITNFGYRHNRHFSILNKLNFEYRVNESFYIKDTT